MHSAPTKSVLKQIKDDLQLRELAAKKKIYQVHIKLDKYFKQKQFNK